jgi:penicillin-binding protein 1C
MKKSILLNTKTTLLFWCKRHPKTVYFFLFIFIFWLFCLPAKLFNKPLSTVLKDKNNELLGAKIAKDGQWRFPATKDIPEKYTTALIAFEDKRFYWHLGIDPWSFMRALKQNLQKGGIKSGGSTLTMQVIRMSRNNPPRNIWEKLVEACMATRLELTHRKKTILSFYAANAPFGGNVVGLEAASWRYFGKNPQLLSWAEAATLAVLPNSPALIHPGRNRTNLLTKRNRLLDALAQQGKINALTCELAKEETLPNAPIALPQLAPHLLERLAMQKTIDLKTPNSANLSNYAHHTTIDRDLQERIDVILQRRLAVYQGNGIHNLSAIVIEVSTGNVLAYHGNVSGTGKEHGESVDILKAPRSTGSILKPYLYALSLESGDILPKSLLHDVPTQLGQYKPENFFETYDGAVPADRALIRSLNIPMVMLLQQYGYEKFHNQLPKLGLTTINQSAEHYGLSLILGGAEANLLDITNVYACMGRTLGKFYERNGRYGTHDFRPPVFLQSTNNQTIVNETKRNWTQQPEILSAGSIWHTFEAMQNVERPNNAGEWELFNASKRIAWKTGTSFGFRDAWAAGVTPKYAVGVWVGNADGEGRPGLLGVTMAAPILFEIFEQLPDVPWFDPPYDDMTQVPVCRKSGFRANEYCEADTLWIPKNGLKSSICMHHQLLHLDKSGHYQVTSDCESPAVMLHLPWFVLPPLEEFYYKSKNPNYQSPPPFRADCMGAQSAQNQSPMQLIYPKQPTKIYVPTDLDGKLGNTVFQLAHREAGAEVFWHLDGVFLQSTKGIHQLALQPAQGKHTLTLVDNKGFRLVQVFEIVSR